MARGRDASAGSHGAGPQPRIRRRRAGHGGASEEVAERWSSCTVSTNTRSSWIPTVTSSLLDAYAGLRAPRARGRGIRRVQALQDGAAGAAARRAAEGRAIDLLTFQRDEIARAQIRAWRRRGAERHPAGAGQRRKAAAPEREAYAALYESDGAVLGALTAIWRRVGRTGDPGPARARRIWSRATPSSRSWRTSPSSCGATPTTSTRRRGGCRKSTTGCAAGAPEAEVRADHGGGARAPRRVRAGARRSGRAGCPRGNGAARGGDGVRANISTGPERCPSRRAAADRFAAALEESLAELAMARTRFAVRFETARDARRVDGRRHGPGGVPRLAEPRRGTAAARPHRLGRRAVAHHAGAAQPVGSDGQGHDARSSTRWTRASAAGPRTMWAEAAAAGQGRAGAVHHAPAADRRVRRAHTSG